MLDITGNLVDPDLKSIAFAPETSGSIFVGRRVEVSRMLVNNPGVWAEFGTGLPEAPVLDLDYDTADKVLVIGTLGRGAWAISVNLGTIVIVKDTVPNAALDFAFTDTIVAPNSFSLDDDADGTLSNTKIFTSVAPGTFTVTEATVPGYTTTVACVNPDGGSTGGTNVATIEATIDLDAGETVTCTFTNTLIVVGGTTLLEDNFNRPNNAVVGVPQVGGPWVELETPSKASVTISNRKLFFVDPFDVDIRPLVKSSFTPTSTGNITWTFDFDWTRTGSEGTYNLLMQLGNGPTMIDNSLDAGVGINLIRSNIGGVHQTLGYRDGSGDHPLQVLSGSAPIKVLANLNANTFTVQVGAGTVHGPFAFHNPVTLSQARYFTHKLNEKNFAGRSFDDVFVATN